MGSPTALPTRSFIALLSLTLAACAPSSASPAPTVIAPPASTSLPAVTHSATSTAETGAPGRPTSLSQADLEALLDLGEAYNITFFLATLASDDVLPTLLEAWPVTLLAPNDRAFLQLPPAAQLELLDDLESRRALALRHSLPGRYFPDQLVAAGAIQTLGGNAVTFTRAAGRVEVGDATIVVTGLETPLGVIHVIDRVLSVE